MCQMQHCIEFKMCKMHKLNACKKWYYTKMCDKCTFQLIQMKHNDIIILLKCGAKAQKGGTMRRILAFIAYCIVLFVAVVVLTVYVRTSLLGL